jgi:hypothetical protein
VSTKSEKTAKVPSEKTQKIRGEDTNQNQIEGVKIKRAAAARQKRTVDANKKRIVAAKQKRVAALKQDHVGAAKPNQSATMKQQKTDTVNKERPHSIKPQVEKAASSTDEAVTAELPTIAGSQSWFSEQNVTRMISVAALLIACGSLLYIANIERKGGLLINSVRAVMTKAGIVGNKPGPGAPDKATLLSAIQYLSAATRGSQPFDTELVVAIKMLENHPQINKALDRLVDGSEKGVPSVEDITTSYGNTVSKLYGFGPSLLFGQAASSISSMVGFTTSARQRQSIIEEVTVQVAAGDLRSALQALDRLDEQAKLPFESWRNQAQQRVALDATVSKIREIALLSIVDGAS